MSGYDLFMSPIELLILKNLRRELIPKSTGDVLEIGIGTGVNFNLYNYNRIKSYTGLDVEISLKAKKRKRNKQTLVSGVAENLQFSDNSFDTVVVTLVLCSVQDRKKALDEIYRVLKPGGNLIFIEHILSSEKIIEKFFYKVDKYWNKFAKCTLCSKTDELIKNSNLTIKHMNKKAVGIFCYGIASK